MELCNKIIEKNKILEEENTLLSIQLKELRELNEKKIGEITALKDDMSGMQSLIDQKTAEVPFNIFLVVLFIILKYSCI